MTDNQDQKVRFWGNNIAITLGLLSIFASATPDTFHLAISGLCILCFSLAYRSIKRRKYALVTQTKLRQGLELVACFVGLLAIAAQNNLKQLMIEDPTNNLLVPLACIIAVSIAFLKKTNKDKLPT